MINVVCDLDGVVYLGDQVIEGVPEAMRRLEAEGARMAFVTNNASRTPEEVAAKITRLTGVDIGPDHVCTSSQAAEALLRPEDVPVFVVGEAGITDILEREGHGITTQWAEARSVIVGLTPRITYDWIADAADAVRQGARFIATNVDPTYPSATGIRPGAGSIAAAIAVAAGVEPEVAGKPHLPIRDLVRRRIGGPAWVIGDRIDTDIEMARLEPGWSSVLVLTGVTAEGVAGVDADHVVADLGAAVDVILGHVERR